MTNTLTDIEIGKLKNNYRSLYEDLLSIGKEEEEVLTILDDVRIKEEKWKEDKSRGNRPRLSFPVAQIKKGVPNWDDLSMQEKRWLMWDCGMDTREFALIIEETLHRDSNNKKVWAPVVSCIERLDEEWLSMRDKNGKRYASLDAIVYGCDTGGTQGGNMWDGMKNKDSYKL